MKKILSLIAAMAATVAISLPAFAVTELTNATFKAATQEKQSGKPIVIMIYADWCSFCHKMMPMLDVAEKKYPSIKFYKFDVSQAPQLMARLPGIPFTILIKGEKNTTISGAPPTQEELNKVLEKTFGVK